MVNIIEKLGLNLWLLSIVELIYIKFIVNYMLSY